MDYESVSIGHGCTEEFDGEYYVTRNAWGATIFRCNISQAQLIAAIERIHVALVAAGIDHWQCPCTTGYAIDKDGVVRCPVCRHTPRSTVCCSCGAVKKPRNANRCRPVRYICGRCRREGLAQREV